MRKLTYIESTGTQYINTGILGRSGLRIELTAELTSNGKYMAFFGAKNTDAAGRLSWFYYQNTELYYYYGSSGYPFVKRADYADKHDYIFDGNKVYIDGASVSFSSSISSAAFTGKYPIAIFACNTNGTVAQHASMRLYAMAIWDGSTLLANYIPAQDESGVVCLYDTVSATYLYNAGTGEFIAGDPITDGGYLIRSTSALYTVTDGALVPLPDAEVSASLFRDYGVDEIPDGALLVGLTDPEVLFWQDSEEELPALTMTVTGAPPLPQIITSDPVDLAHESISAIDHVTANASEDVRFSVSFNGGGTWMAHDGTNWFQTTETEPGMLASTMNAITTAQWAEIATLTSCQVRAWLPTVTSYVDSVVFHYINP